MENHVEIYNIDNLYLFNYKHRNGTTYASNMEVGMTKLYDTITVRKKKCKFHRSVAG